jgi:alkanesulfonate monooxygenase SsuD/methylene tetrahydromethanopterin reductase-like flavin-dependent oxidoreductase (luciferase family)
MHGRREDWMKFHWFHLMPYPALPEDFKQRYRSVWIDPPARELYDPAIGCQAYNDYLDELEHADQEGFDGICVNEHHANAYGLMPSPNLMAAALARRTSNAKLVVMGNSVALYDPPIRVAEEMAMLDVLSGGRLVAGFPVGTPMDTAYAMGQNPVTLRDKYREGVGLVLRAWSSDKPFAFNGRHTQLRYVNPWPRPMQQPHPPVWIPGGGSIETWDWCAENDFLYAYLSYFGYRQAQTAMAGYWQAVERAGRDPNPYRAGFLQFIAVAEDDDHAEELYGEAALYFYERCMHLYPGYTSPPGYSTPATLRSRMGGQVRQAAQGQPGPLTWKRIVDSGFIVAGSPARVTEQVSDMADSLNVGHLMLLLHFGNLKKETVLYNTRRFAREVAPALRPRFGEWQDRWWPSSPAPAPREPEPVG